jgi:hypothetical protein
VPNSGTFPIGGFCYLLLGRGNERKIMREEYNGWKNRETWAMALWLNNDEGFQNQVQELAEEARDEEYPASRLAEALESFIEELFDFDNISDNRQLFNMLTDIGSLYRVNWYEIAQTFIEELANA